MTTISKAQETLNFYQMAEEAFAQGLTKEDGKFDKDTYFGGSRACGLYVVTHNDFYVDHGYVKNIPIGTFVFSDAISSLKNGMDRIAGAYAIVQEGKVGVRVDIPMRCLKPIALVPLCDMRAFIGDD